MGTTVEDLVRLAWQVDAEGKPGMRDALLTLAVAEGGVDDAVLAERCRRVLVAHRPDHWFATSAPLSQALNHTKVVQNLTRLRCMFPPVRVKWLLMRGAAQTGPYTGKTPSPIQLLRDLTPRTRRDAGARPVPHARSLPFPGLARAAESIEEVPDNLDPEGSLITTYLTVLLAMAVLVKSVIEVQARDSRAA